MSQYFAGIKLSPCLLVVLVVRHQVLVLAARGADHHPGPRVPGLGLEDHGGHGQHQAGARALLALVRVIDGLRLPLLVVQLTRLTRAVQLHYISLFTNTNQLKVMSLVPEMKISS